MTKPAPTKYSARYRAAYSDGRHSGAEGVPETVNPHLGGTVERQAWADGHFDARSAKNCERERYSRELWSRPA